MSDKDKNTIAEEDIIADMQEEMENLENEEHLEEMEESEEKQEEPKDKTKELLAKTMADFDNYKKRVQRDREEMIFFLKTDILKKILPRIDDIDRIIKNTPEDLQGNSLFEWILSVKKKLVDDLEKMWVKSFDYIWETVNPDFHDVMTVVPGQKTGIIFDEFEKWYLLDGKVLRHAKVIVWA